MQQLWQSGSKVSKKFTQAGRMVQPVQNFGMPNLNFTLNTRSL